MRDVQRVTADRTAGLTADDFVRSRAVVGNRQRLARVAHRLINKNEPIHMVVCGGSISIGHGVYPETLRYSARLQEWLNHYFPLSEQTESHQKYLVTSMAAHGADVCEKDILQMNLSVNL